MQDIIIEDYESHMSSESIMQLQVLSDITKQQFDEYACKQFAYLALLKEMGSSI